MQHPTVWRCCTSSSISDLRDPDRLCGPPSLFGLSLLQVIDALTAAPATRSNDSNSESFTRLEVLLYPTLLHSWDVANNPRALRTAQRARATPVKPNRAEFQPENAQPENPSMMQPESPNFSSHSSGTCGFAVASGVERARTLRSRAEVSGFADRRDNARWWLSASEGRAPARRKAMFRPRE